jgi:hypothetical protein
VHTILLAERKRYANAVILRNGVFFPLGHEHPIGFHDAKHERLSIRNRLFFHYSFTKVDGHTIENKIGSGIIHIFFDTLNNGV